MVIIETRPFKLGYNTIIVSCFNIVTYFLTHLLTFGPNSAKFSGLHRSSQDLTKMDKLAVLQYLKKFTR